MSRDSHAPIVVPRNVMYYNEVPRTLFVDWLSAVEVKMVNGPQRSSIFQAMAEMREASYSPDLKTARQRARDEVAAQGAGDHPLSLNLEIPHFTFLINGVSRAMTHQIVRTRIGVTYAQKCTGDGDIRHDAALVPRGLQRDERSLEAYIDSVLEFKRWYAELIDGGGSIHIGRYLMPHCLSQYIYMDISLLALVTLYGKRMCPEQPIEWQAIGAGMKRALSRQFPEFAAMLVSNCDRHNCHWIRRGNNDERLGRLYFPDEQHDTEPWNPESFLHQGTVEEIEGGPRFSARFYHGKGRVW